MLYDWDEWDAQQRDLFNDERRVSNKLINRYLRMVRYRLENSK